MKKLAVCMCLSVLSTFAYCGDSEDDDKTLTKIEVINPPNGIQMLVIKSDEMVGSNKLSTLKVYSSDCKNGSVSLDIEEHFINNNKFDLAVDNKPMSSEKNKFFYDLVCRNVNHGI